MHKVCKPTTSPPLRAAVSLVILLFSATLSMAQTQQGYVKTKGRLGVGGKLVPGTRLPGATIMLQGGSSTSSAAGGAFSLRATGGKFTLQKVMKEGYELVDADALKSYRCSANPLVLTMETRLQQRTDKSDAARLVRRQLNKKIDQQREEIERLREENRLTEEKYQEALNRLLDMEESNQNLVERMAEEYSKIDYDLVDDFNRQFNALFLAGELEKADSLLKTRGNILSDVAELQRLKQANEAVSRQLERSRAMEKRKTEDLSERCHMRQQLFLMQHQMDSAAYYMELRAQLDTTDIRQQLETGHFLKVIMENMAAATPYFQRALSQATATGDSTSMAEVYRELAGIRISQGKFAEAVELLNKAIEMARKHYGSDHPDMISFYRTLAKLHYTKRELPEALSCQEQVLAICVAAYGGNDERSAAAYKDIGAIYIDMGEMDRALEVLQKAETIYTALGDTESAHIGDLYHSLGTAHYYKGNRAEAKHCFEKSIAISLSFFGSDMHSSLADTYGNLAYLCAVSKEFDQALDYQQRALRIFRTLYGERHMRVAWCHSIEGLIYTGMGQYDKALDCYTTKALPLFIDLFGENSSVVARTYLYIVDVYLEKGDCAQAAQHLDKAQAIGDSLKKPDAMLQKRLDDARSKLSDAKNGK